MTYYIFQNLINLSKDTMIRVKWLGMILLYMSSSGNVHPLLSIRFGQLIMEVQSASPNFCYTLYTVL